MSGTTEALEGIGAAARVIGGYRSHNHDGKPQSPPQGDLHLAQALARPAKDSLPFSDTEIAIQNRIRNLVSGFSEFPSGLHFPDRIFYYTNCEVPDQRGRMGMKVITVDKDGEMAMVETYEENVWGEWDISPDCAKRVALTGSDVRRYAGSLLDTMSIRFTDPRLRVATEEEDANRVAAINRDLGAIKAAKQEIEDLLAGAVANSAATPTTTPQ